MSLSTGFKSKTSSHLIRGALIGFVAGVAFAIETWFMAGIIKVLLTWETGIWPDWFPGYIPDFILSGWWLIIVILLFTIVGAIVGAMGSKRPELL